jgi:hypothetical protein
MKLAVTRRDALVQPPEAEASGDLSTGHLRAVSDRFGRSLFATSVQSAMKKRGIAYDDQASDFLDNREVKAVLGGIKTKLGRPVDVLGMDACLMSMVEVAYQVRTSAAYIAGSEETEPGAGWPYHTILAGLAANPAMTPKDLSALIVTKYLASYRATDSVTQSALNQANVARLRTAVEALGKKLQAGMNSSTTRLAILDARRRVQKYATPAYVDLVDLCAQLKARPIPATLKTTCDAVTAAVGQFVVKSGYKGSGVARSNGTSIYFPTHGVSPLYQTLDFAAKSQWAKFLAAYNS